MLFLHHFAHQHMLPFHHLPHPFPHQIQVWIAVNQQRVFVVVHLETGECGCLSACLCGEDVRVSVVRVVSWRRFVDFAALGVVMLAIPVWWHAVVASVCVRASAPVLSLSLYVWMMIEILCE